MSIFYGIYCRNRVVNLPWICPGAPMIFNGASWNIQGNLDRYEADENIPTNKAIALRSDLLYKHDV